MENQYQTEAAAVKHNNAAVGSGIDESQEIDLLLLFNALRRHILIIIAVALVFALGAGIVVQFFITPLYTPTTLTYLVATGSSSLLELADLNIANNIAPDYSDVIKSRTILEHVIETMQLPYKYEEFYENISVVNPADTHIIKITVTDADPYRAKEIANELTFYAVDRIADIMGTKDPYVYDEAVVAKRPSYPSLTKTVVIAFVLGAVLAAGVIVFITVMDTTVKTAEDIENRCGMVTLTKVYYEGGKKKKGYGYGGYGGYGYGYGYGTDGQKNKSDKPHTHKKNGGAENK